jgi:hypothetical protein
MAEKAVHEPVTGKEYDIYHCVCGNVCHVWKAVADRDGKFRCDGCRKVVDTATLEVRAAGPDEKLNESF